MLIMYGYRRTSRSNLTFLFIYIAMVPSISNTTLVNHNSVSLGCHDRWQVHRSICEKWAVQMGGATKRSFISTYFLLNAYFLTAHSYKRMRLTTQVYGICGTELLRSMSLYNRHSLRAFCLASCRGICSLSSISS